MEALIISTETHNIPLDLLLLADPEEAAVNQYLDRSIGYTLNVNGDTIGAVLLLPTRPHTLELVNVAVAEEWQGKGYGKKLVQHAIQCARELGYQVLEVGTGNSSLSQLGLYQKCGFRICGIDTDFFVIHYDEPIEENGIPCVDMIRLRLIL
ncbi:GCN5-like N-acetyltransferase [Paenibacillus alvei TS-15]|uniref:GCN5-like N-acetyltransferase n=1 Tax=Paenibacillus alvei TS-15 TaxID=1117108 RepID=S9TRF1_PAEAL|nr:GNAT family N-acetyltransferase [Paenibacillus alvei]EPY04886.1 GCN5-like N-acetyltransferase [Paenibacillus alvei TS-15]